MTHICGKQSIIGSDNGLSPGRRQAIIRTNAGILLIGPPGTNFGEILIGIQIFSIKEIQLKMSSAKWRPFCLGLSGLKESIKVNLTREFSGSTGWQVYATFKLRPRQNGRLFADDVFKGIFLNENVWILIKMSSKFVPKGPINNIPALVLIMAWRRPGDKPLSEPMLVRSLTHICVTRPQWVNETTPVIACDISWYITPPVTDSWLDCSHIM